MWRRITILAAGSALAILSAPLFGGESEEEMPHFSPLSFDATQPDFSVVLPGSDGPAMPVRWDSKDNCYKYGDKVFPGGLDLGEGYENFENEWSAITETAKFSAKAAEDAARAVEDWFDENRDKLRGPKGDPGDDGEDAVECNNASGCAGDFANLYAALKALDTETGITNTMVVTDVNFETSSDSGTGTGQTLYLLSERHTLGGADCPDGEARAIVTCQCKFNDDDDEEDEHWIVVEKCSPDCLGAYHDISELEDLLSDFEQWQRDFDHWRDSMTGGHQ